MKKIIFALFLLVLSLGALASCDLKEEEGQGQEEPKTIDVSGVKMADLTIDYDGELHTIQPTNLPEGVVALPSGTVRFREPGTYTITYSLVASSDPDTELKKISATLVIKEVGGDPNQGGNGDDPNQGGNGDDPNQGGNGGEGEQGYKVKVGSQEFALSANPGAEGEFMASITVEAGQVLTFTLNGQPLTVTADPWQTNNIDENMTVKASGSNLGLYLKADMSVWLDAPAEGGGEHTLKVSIGEQEYELNRPEGWTSVTATVTANKDDVVQILVDGSASSDYYAVTSDGNNLGEGLVVLSDCFEVSIYVNDDKSVWLDGFNSGGGEGGEDATLADKYYVRIGEGEPQELSLNESANLGENQIGELQLTNIALEAGQELVFIADDQVIAKIGPDQYEGNNLELVEEKLLVKADLSAAEGKGIFLKAYKDGGYSVWVDSNPEAEDEFVLLVGEDTIELAKNEGGEWVALNIELHQGDLIKAKNLKDSDGFNLGLNEAAAEVLAFDEEAQTVKVLADGHYDLYLQLALGNDKLYAESHKEDGGNEENQLASVYKVQIGEGEAQELALNESANLGENQLAELQLVNIALEAGQELVFFADDEVIAKIGPDQYEGNNVELSEDKLLVKANLSATEGKGIFLKAYNDGGYSVWVDVDPEPEDEFVLLVGEETIELAKNEKGEWVVKNIELHQGDLITAKNLKDSVEFNLGLNEAASEVLAFDEEAQTVKVLADGNYDLYLQLEVGNDKLYAGLHLELDTTKLFLNIGDSWDKEDANERFVVYFFKNESSEGAGDGYEAWAALTPVEGNEGNFVVEIDANATHAIFCRMNGEAEENVWENKWNQTADLEISGHEGMTYYIENINGAGHWY